MSTMPEHTKTLCAVCSRTIYYDAGKRRWVHDDTRSPWCNGSGSAYAEPLSTEGSKQVSDDPVADRIEERVKNIKNGDPSEAVHDPEREQKRADKSAAAAAKREKERAQHEAVREQAFQRMQGKKEPRGTRRAADPEGSKQVTTTATKPKKSTAKKSTAKSTTAKKQPAKATAAKSNGSGVDLSGKLPFTITWTEPASVGGAEHTRTYWRGARLDIKAFLEDEGKMSDQDIDDGLKSAADKLRAGKGHKIGSVTITVNK